MSFRVKIENFQSIEYADLEVSGLTIITGQNNAGKSAIMRAIRAVFTNPRTNSYIRWHKDHVRVRIEFDDGKYIVWEKVGKRATKGKTKGKLVNIKTNYEVNGERFEGVSGSVPEAVLQQGVKSISVGNKDLWPQIAKQVKDVYFLVDMPGHFVAEAVSDVDRVGVLNRAIRACESDVRSNTATLKLRKQDKQNHSDRLESFNGLDAVIKKVEAVEDLHSRVTKTGKVITKVRGMRDSILEAQAQVDLLSPALDIEVPDSKRATDLRTVHTELTTAVGLRGRLESSVNEVKKYAPVASVTVPDAAVTNDLRATLEELNGARDLQRRLKQAQDEVENLPENLEIDLSDPLTKLDKVFRVLTKVTDIRGRQVDAQSKVDAEMEALDKSEQELDAAKAELAEFEGEFPRCSECGQFRIVEATG